MNKNIDIHETSIVPDLTDINEVRKSIIASEILNRKY
jgi:hypothetical protein